MPPRNRDVYRAGFRYFSAPSAVCDAKTARRGCLSTVLWMGSSRWMVLRRSVGHRDLGLGGRRGRESRPGPIRSVLADVVLLDFGVQRGARNAE